ncbi:MAG: hypothetical protein PVF27_03670 [Gemmatimonadales bacterium]|jgi:hypothetical protein
MADYTPLGIEKISMQASRDLRTIRCPRDSVVMRILCSHAERDDGKEPHHRSFDALPRGRAWRVTTLDLECPACRRKALGVHPATQSERASPEQAGVRH